MRHLFLTKDQEREGYRNGSRTRKLKTTNGMFELKKPQIREFVLPTICI